MLDDPTSAISFEIEDYLFNYAKQLEITLITISHKEQLKRYHDFVLQIELDVIILIDKF